MPSVKTEGKERCLRDSILSVLSFFLYTATTNVKEGEFNWKSKEDEQKKKKKKNDTTYKQRYTSLNGMFWCHL